METNFNFKSQICTSIEQSERLLSLGLKKETADCCYLWHWESDSHSLYAASWEGLHRTTSDIPAWSLHRLIEMVAGGSEEQMIFLPDPYDELIEEIAGAIMVGCFPKVYLV